MTLIYTNPQTQSQLRRVLQDINVRLVNIENSIADVGTFVSTSLSPITDGQIVRIDSGALALAQADSATNARAIGAKQSQDGLDIRVALSDVVTRTGWGLTPGVRYFLSATTAGEIVSVPDSTSSGAVALPVGYALSATQLFVRIGTPIFF